MNYEGWRSSSTGWQGMRGILNASYPFCMLTIQLPSDMSIGPPPTIRGVLWMKQPKDDSSPGRKTEDEWLGCLSRRASDLLHPQADLDSWCLMIHRPSLLYTLLGDYSAKYSGVLKPDQQRLDEVVRAPRGWLPRRLSASDQRVSLAQTQTDRRGVRHSPRGIVFCEASPAERTEETNKGSGGGN